MPNVSELSTLPVLRANPASTDYVVGVIGISHGQPTSVLVPVANVTSGLGGGLVNNTTAITGGAGNQLLYDKGGTLGELSLGIGLTISSGMLVANGELTINSSPILSGSNGNFLYNNSNTVGERTPTQATAALNLFTNSLQGLVPGSGGGTTNFLRADGTWAAPPTTPPGGSATQLQYNAGGGNFGGAAGTTWDTTNQALTIASIANPAASTLTLTGGTGLTTSQPVLNMTQTWNAGGVTFTALKLNVTNTASAAGSKLVDFQIGGTSQFNITPTTITFAPAGTDQLDWGVTNTGWWTFGTNTAIQSSKIATVTLALGSSGNVPGNTGGSITINNSDNTLVFEASSVFNFNNAAQASATGLFVYNTSDTLVGSPTNYERGVFDWTTNSNVLTIGTQVGGTGTVRSIQFVVGNNGTIQVNGSDGALWLRSAATGTRFILGNNVDLAIAEAAAGVLEINNGTAGTLTGTYLHWGGQARTTGTQNFTTTTFAAVTGLTVNVAASRNYYFRAHIPVTANGSTGGIKVNIAGTCTATNIIYDVWSVSNNAITGQQQVTSLGAANTGSLMGAATGYVELSGLITVNAAGTLIVQAAENTASGTTVTGQGATFVVHDMP